MSDNTDTSAPEQPVKETLDLGLKVQIMRGALASKALDDDAARLMFTEMIAGSMRYTNTEGETFLRYKLGARRLAGVLTGRTDQTPGEIGAIVDPVIKILEDGGWIELMRPGRKSQGRRPGEFAAWRLNLAPKPGQKP